MIQHGPCLAVIAVAENIEVIEQVVEIVQWQSFSPLLASRAASAVFRGGPLAAHHREGIVKLSRIGLPDPQHARLTKGLEPIILGVGQPSFS